MSRMRLTPYLSCLLLLLLIPLTSASASRPRACASAPITLEHDIEVSPQGPTFVLTVRYPNGRTRLYEGDEIPSRVTVPPGSTVKLELSLRSGESGKHTPRACAESLTDLPEDDVVSVTAVASGRGDIGEFSSYAQVTIRRYWQDLRVRLEVSYSHVGRKEGTTVSKAVTVSVVSLITLTLIQPTTSTSASATTTSTTTSTTAATTIAEATGSTSTESTSTSSSGGSGGSRGSTTASSSEEGFLTINPSSMRVDAGDIAVFDLCTSLSSPTFRVEDLPTGYRYVITPSGDCYKLKVFTHPLSYGRFKMTVVAKSGRAEERGNLSLLVKRAETPSPTTSSQVGQSPTPTPTLEGSAGGGGGVTSSTPSRATGTQATVTVVTVIKKEEPPIELLAGSGVALLLAALLALLLVRRR